MNILIEAKNLSKTYNGRTVVNNLSIQICRGEITALIGPNGAGKTTTLSMMLGIVPPDKNSGSIKYWREDYKAHLGAQLQSTPFFEGYSAEENLELFSALYNMKIGKQQIEDILKKFELFDVRKTSALRLSIGQQKRLAIAVTTLHNPELIILDEPTAGLDPKAKKDIRDMITRLSQNNISVIFSSHDLDEVWKVANRVVFINEGQIALEGNPQELLENYQTTDLEALYLQLIEKENKI